MSFCPLPGKNRTGSDVTWSPFRVEMSTGVEINVFPPERAAVELREALG